MNPKHTNVEESRKGRISGLSVTRELEEEELAKEMEKEAEEEQRCATMPALTGMLRRIQARQPESVVKLL